MNSCILGDVNIFTGYSYIGTCKEFIWKLGDKIAGKQMPSHFYFKGLKLEYDVEALMIRRDLYLRTKDNKEYIVKEFQIIDINDSENISGIAMDMDLLFEKFPEMKSITSGEKVIVNKKTQVVAFKAVSDVIHNVKNGHSIDTASTNEVSKTLVEDVLSAPDAIMNLMDIKSFDDYTFTHNINVSTISLFIGEALGLDKADLEDLGMGCMLHDVGKINIPLEILNKNGKLTDEEFAQMKSHPMKGYEILQRSKGISERAKRIALEHHEKFDGSGYPNRISKETISLFGRICAVADVYDALTTDRPYRVAMQPYDAMKILVAGMDKHFDPHILNTFIRKFSIYPAGSLVKMNNGSIALVLRNNPQAVIRPVIKLITNEKGRHVSERIEIDLLTDKTLFITGPAERSSLNVTSKNANL